MIAEMEALEKSKTREWGTRLQEEAMGCKWLYNMKYKPDGILKR